MCGWMGRFCIYPGFGIPGHTHCSQIMPGPNTTTISIIKCIWNPYVSDIADSIFAMTDTFIPPNMNVLLKS